jgi:hypothetical protein
MNKIMNKIKEAIGLANEKVRYPIINKIMFVEVINKLVKKIDFVSLYNI